MKPEREKEVTGQYRERISQCLKRGSEEGYRELQTLCEEEAYGYLLERNKEFLLLRQIMRIWDRETATGHPLTDTIIGRAAAFCGCSYPEVSVRSLIDLFTIAKFAFFRLEADLPDEQRKEGVIRVLLTGLTAEALILVARNTAEDEQRALTLFVEELASSSLRETCPTGKRTEQVLRDYLMWLQTGREEDTPEQENT